MSTPRLLKKSLALMGAIPPGVGLGLGAGVGVGVGIRVGVGEGVGLGVGFGVGVGVGIGVGVGEGVGVGVGFGVGVEVGIGVGVGECRLRAFIGPLITEAWATGTRIDSNARSTPVAPKLRATEKKEPLIRINLPPLLTAKWSLLEFQNPRHATRNRRDAKARSEQVGCLMCQKRHVELCVPISAGVTYRVRKCNVLCLIR